jgi:hypothetical protein
MGANVRRCRGQARYLLDCGRGWIGPDPFPFFDVRLGWRYQITDYTGVLTGSDVSEASYGVIMGAGFHW